MLLQLHPTPLQGFLSLKECLILQLSLQEWLILRLSLEECLIPQLSLEHPGLQLVSQGCWEHTQGGLRKVEELTIVLWDSLLFVVVVSRASYWVTVIVFTAWQIL